MAVSVGAALAAKGIVAKDGFTRVTVLSAAPLVIPAQAGIQCNVSTAPWIPACAGMTKRYRSRMPETFATTSLAAKGIVANGVTICVGRPFAAKAAPTSEEVQRLPVASGQRSGAACASSKVAAGCKGKKVAGFTLVEVLIGLALLSLLMLGLTGAMRAMSDTSQGIERRIDSTDRYRVAAHLLEAVLGGVSVRRLPNAGANPTARGIFFEASAHSLAWIGVMPARYGVGGRHYLRLSVEGDQLVLRYVPWNGAATFADWGSAAAQVVAEPVTGFDLRYLEPESQQWLPAWPPESLRPNIVLPGAIEATIHGLETPWPPLVVATRGLAATDPTILKGAWGP